MAVGPTKLAFFSVKQGWKSGSIDKLLAVHIRSDVADLRVMKGALTAGIKVILSDGTNYEFECGRVVLDKLEGVRTLLGKI